MVKKLNKFYELQCITGERKIIKSAAHPIIKVTGPVQKKYNCLGDDITFRTNKTLTIKSTCISSHCLPFAIRLNGKYFTGKRLLLLLHVS